MDQDVNSSPDPFGGPSHHATAFGLGHPFMFIALAVAVLLFILGLMMGKQMRRAEASRDGDRVLEDIYVALRQAGAAAAGATNGNVIGAASYLWHQIDDRLGPFAKLGGELKKKMAELEKVRDEVSGAAKAKKKDHHDGRTITVLAAGEMVMASQPPADAVKHSPVEMARLAIGAFNDYWGDAGARMDDLRKARDKLTSTPPVPRTNPGQTPAYTGPALSTNNPSAATTTAQEPVSDPAPTL